MLHFLGEKSELYHLHITLIHLIALISLNSTLIDILTNFSITIDIFIPKVTFAIVASVIVVASSITMACMKSSGAFVKINTCFWQWPWNQNISGFAIAFIWSFSVSASRIRPTKMLVMITRFFRFERFRKNHLAFEWQILVQIGWIQTLFLGILKSLSIPNVCWVLVWACGYLPNILV